MFWQKVKKFFFNENSKEYKYFVSYMFETENNIQFSSFVLTRNQLITDSESLESIKKYISDAWGCKMVIILNIIPLPI